MTPDPLPCDFIPAHEPWTCRVHRGVRTSLGEPQCDIARPAEPFNDAYLDNIRQGIAEGRNPSSRYITRRLLATIDRPTFINAWIEAEAVLSDGWALRLTSRPTAGYRAEALHNDKVKVYAVASTPDGALRELSDVITESHVND